MKNRPKICYTIDGRLPPRQEAVMSHDDQRAGWREHPKKTILTTTTDIEPLPKEKEVPFNRPETGNGWQTPPKGTTNPRLCVKALQKPQTGKILDSSILILLERVKQLLQAMIHTKHMYEYCLGVLGSRMVFASIALEQVAIHAQSTANTYAQLERIYVSDSTSLITQIKKVSRHSASWEILKNETELINDILLIDEKIHRTKYQEIHDEIRRAQQQGNEHTFAIIELMRADYSTGSVHVLIAEHVELIHILRALQYHLRIVTSIE